WCSSNDRRRDSFHRTWDRCASSRSKTTTLIMERALRSKLRDNQSSQSIAGHRRVSFAAIIDDDAGFTVSFERTLGKAQDILSHFLLRLPQHVVGLKHARGSFMGAAARRQ